MREMKESETKALIIRPMTNEDAERASELESMVFSMPWKADDFLEMIERTYAHYFVAVKNDTIVGIIGLRDVAGEGEISNVATHPDFRRQNIASMLMQRALEECDNLGISDITLEVRTSNKAAIALYEKYGFKGEGVRPIFYEKPREDALIMWRRLNA